MKFEHSTYQQPLSMVGLGGGATSLGRGGASAQNYWPFTTDRLTIPTKTPVYTFGETTARTSLLPTTGFFMKPDGSAMFTMQIDNKIRRHTMSTAWDISTAKQDQVTPARLSTTLAGTNAETLRGLEFNPDGTKVYYANTDYIYEYSLSTAWDLTTIASSHTHALSPGHSSTKTITSFKFRPNGNQLYIAICALEDGQTYSNDGVFPKDATYVPYYSASGDSEVREFMNYSGSSYWYQLNYYSSRNTFTSIVGGIVGLCFNTQDASGGGGGDHMYLVCNDGGTWRVNHYPLGSDWSISSQSVGSSNNISLYDLNHYVFGLGLNPVFRDPSGGSSDGSYYGSTDVGDYVYYPLWNRRIYQEKAGGYGNYTNSNNVSVFGMSAYYGSGWRLVKDDSTYENFFSPDSQSSTNPSSGGFNENDLECVTFKPDGTKVYVHVYQYPYSTLKVYDMTTAWDLRTIDSTSKVTYSSYNTINEFKNANGDNQFWTHMQWDSTGTRLLCGPGRAGNYYKSTFAVLNFSTAYDPSTYTGGNRFLLSNSVWPSYLPPDTGCVSADGKHMYAYKHDSSYDRIYQYSTSTAFNYYGASAAGTYDLPDLINRMEISPDGTQMITLCDQIVDTGGGYNKPIPAEISSYTLSTPYDITTATPDNKTTVIGALNIPSTDMRYYNKSEVNFTVVDNGEGAAENGIYMFHTNSGVWGYKLEAR